MGFYTKDGTYIDDSNINQDQADSAYAANQTRNMQPSTPNVPAADLKTMVNWSVPAKKDAQGRTYQVSYTGTPIYINDGSQAEPQNTFMHQYAWDPTTGNYKSSLNRGGIIGALEGAAALGGPLVLGAMAGGGAAGGAAGAINTGFDTAGMSSIVPSAVGGASADAGLSTAALSGILPSSTPISSAMGMQMVPGSVASNMTGGAGSGSFLSRLLGSNNKTNDLSSVLGSYSSGQKANRVVQGQFTNDYDQLGAQIENQRNQMGIASQNARNQNESDALNKLQQTSYIQNRQNYKPTSITLNGKQVQLPDYGFGPKASTPIEIQGATDLQNQLLSRLSPGGSFTPDFSFKQQPLSGYAKPGIGEQIGSNGAVITGLLGLLNR